MTSREGGYDLAHEALVRAWPRLRAWLDEDQVGQQIRRHLAMAAAGWEALDRSDTELYRGARLASAVDWLERGHEPLADTERDFIEASRLVADDEVRRLADDARRQRRQNRRLRWLVAAAAALLVASTLAAWSALDRGRQAERGRDAAAASAATAATSAATARHESVVARSLALRSTSKQVAALMAVQAWKERPDVLAQSALVANLTSDPGFLGYRAINLVADYPLPLAAADVSTGNGPILVAAGSSVALADPLTGELASASFSRRTADSLRRSVLRVSADGSRAVQLLTTSTDPRCEEGSSGGARGCTALVVYDLATRATVMGPVTTPFPGADVAISRDGSLVARGGRRRGEVATWDVLTGRRLAGLAGVDTVPLPRGTDIGGATAAVAFGRGDRLYVGTVRGDLREVSARTMRVRRTWPAPALTTNRRIVTVGDRLFAGGDRGQLAVDLRGGRMLWVAGGDTSGVSGCHQLDVSTKVDAVYCATDTGQVVVRDARHRGALRPPPRAPVREGRLAGRDGWRQHPAGVQWRGSRVRQVASRRPGCRGVPPRPRSGRHGWIRPDRSAVARQSTAGRGQRGCRRPHRHPCPTSARPGPGRLAVSRHGRGAWSKADPGRRPVGPGARDGAHGCARSPLPRARGGPTRGPSRVVAMSSGCAACRCRPGRSPPRSRSRGSVRSAPSQTGPACSSRARGLRRTGARRGSTSRLALSSTRGSS